MRRIYTFIIALSLLFLIEFVSTVLYTTFINPTVESGSLYGKIITYSIVFISVGGFLFALIYAYIKQKRTN